MACDAGWVTADPYRGHRFPEEIISPCVWLYFTFWRLRPGLAFEPDTIHFRVYNGEPMADVVPVQKRGLTPAMYGALVDVPADVEWQANMALHKDSYRKGHRTRNPQ